MAFLFEFIVSLLVDGGVEISSDTKISRWARYPILAVLILFFSAVILGILAFGISLWEKNILCALAVILTGLVLLAGSILKFRQVYKREKNLKK